MQYIRKRVMEPGTKGVVLKENPQGGKEWKSAAGNRYSGAVTFESNFPVEGA